MIRITNKDGFYSILVQKCDIEKLKEFKINIPISIISKFDNEQLSTNNNQVDFIEYIEPEEIEFFLSQEWILDYDTLKYFSNIELEIAKKSLLVEIATLKKRLKHLSHELEFERNLIAIELEKKKYMLETILSLKKIKRTKAKTEMLLFSENKTK